MAKLQPTALECPRCAPHADATSARRPPLYRSGAAGVSMHGCGACGGVFLPRACADRLASTLPEEAIDVADRASSAARFTPDLGAPTTCPVCKKPMARAHAARAGVEIDNCATCGTWYDKDEIRRVTDAIRASGWGGAAAASGAAAGVAAAAVAAEPAQASAARAQTGFDAGEVLDAGVEAVGAGLEAADLLDGVFGILGSIFD